MDDFVEGIREHWGMVNEGEAPKRDAIVTAVTGFKSTGKRHPQNGGLRKSGKTWGFDND